MKGFYERYADLAKERRYSVEFDMERGRIDGESQFLNSLPGEKPLIGMIPLTGKGIDEEVDDLFFVSI